MIKATKTNNEGGEVTPRKRDVFLRFVDWITLSIEQRNKIGVPNQKSFAEKYKIEPATLSDWKKRNDFIKLKSSAQIERLQNETTDVLNGLAARCKKYGMAYDIELFLLYVEGWERKHILERLAEIKLGDDDIRTLVDLLPKEKQSQFYDVLTNLLAEARNTRVIE